MRRRRRTLPRRSSRTRPPSAKRRRPTTPSEARIDRASAEVVADARFSSEAREVHASRERFYLPELDLLRFLACTTIFLQHVYQHTPAHLYPAMHPDWGGRLVQIFAWSGGYSVDLFLALSAFLITQLLLRERETTGAINLRRFYLRRILRIWPLYYFYLIVIALAGLWFAPFYASPKWLILSALLSANIANALWGWTPTFVASHLWTIAVEEHFYLVWPAIVRKLRPRGIAIAALAMLAVSFATRAVCWMVDAPGAFVWTNTLTRLDPLAVGILLALYLRHRKYAPHALVRAALLLAGPGIMLMVSAYCDPYRSPNSALTLFFGYPAVALGCVVILLGFHGMRLNQERFLDRAGIYLGRISYGLYIWQMTAIVLVVRGLDRPLPVSGDWVDSVKFAAACAFVLNIGIAAASYRWVETPFLRLKSRFAVVPSRPE
ncbi:MAG TPA: acyltransferase [Candidatus Binataceae bacterium]|nr:acyltransferase [Candidatus Binataceae bacterium]